MGRKKTFDEPVGNLTVFVPTRILNRVQAVRPWNMPLAAIVAEGLELWAASREDQQPDAIAHAAALDSLTQMQTETEDAKTETTRQSSIPPGRVPARRHRPG